MRPLLRRYWIVLHRWVGLSVGCLLLVAAVSGSLLVLARPLDEAMHPELFRSHGNGRVPLQPVVTRLRAEFGPEAVFNIRLPVADDASLHVSVTGPWRGTVYLDNASGRELGRRGAGQGFFNALFELHSSLYAGDTGRAVLAGAALAYGAMLTSGVVLWWPRRWRHACSVRTRSGRALALLDLHRVAGATLGLLVLVSVVTGAYMAWRPLAGWVTYLGGGPPAALPTLKLTSDSPATPAPVDAAILHAQKHWPHAVVSVAHVPARSSAVLRARVRLPDDSHPIGMSTVWLDPVSGEVRAARRWSELEAGSRAFSIVYPLHTGSLSGWTTLLATLISGMALAGFGVTGVWLWWHRRFGNPAHRLRTATPGLGKFQGLRLPLRR